MNGSSKREVSRLWIISELYYPEETSTGHHVTMIAEGLSEDFDVNVLCGQPNYSKRGVDAPKAEVHNRVNIRRLPGTRLNKNVIPFRIINMLTLGVPILFTSLFRFRKGDSALVVTTPPNLPFAVALASLVRGVEYTLLIHDNYPDALVAAGKASPDSVLVRAWRFCNRWLFKHASRIIVLGRDMKELIDREAEGLDVPVVYIPNWAELDLIEPMDRSENRLLKQLGLEDKFVLLYAGNMSYTSELEGLIYCAERLSENRDIHFVFLGDGARKSELVGKVNRKKLNNVTILDPKPRSDQPEFLNACDVAVVALVEGMRGVSVPSRIYNALAAGKPILGVTEAGSELTRMIDESGVGWWVPPGQFDDLLRTIKQLASEKENVRKRGRLARAEVEHKYSFDIAIEKYRMTFAANRSPEATCARRPESGVSA